MATAGVDVVCPECQFDPDPLGRAEVIAAIRGLAKRYQAPLTRFLKTDSVTVANTRPSHGVFSAVEYAAHMLDVFSFAEDRLTKVLSEVRPDLPGWDPDRLAIERDDNTREAAAVAASIALAAQALAVRLEGLEEADWQREGMRDGVAYRVLWWMTRVAHEGSHHLLDVGRVLRQVRSVS